MVYVEKDSSIHRLHIQLMTQVEKELSRTKYYLRVPVRTAIEYIALEDRYSFYFQTMDYKQLSCRVEFARDEVVEGVSPERLKEKAAILAASLCLAVDAKNMSEAKCDTGR